MKGLHRKTDYYKDHSIKAVYFVDEQGQKQGEYVEYEPNSRRKVKFKGKYVDNILRQREYPKSEEYPGGIVEELDKYGKVERVIEEYSNVRGKSKNIDLYYKEGKPWQGKHIEKIGDVTEKPVTNRPGVEPKKEAKCFEHHYENGNLTGHWLEEGRNGYFDFEGHLERDEKFKESANFQDGVLQGDYEASSDNSKHRFKFVDLKKFVTINPDFYDISISGHFNAGVFSGEIRVGSEGRREPASKCLIKDGALTYSKEYHRFKELLVERKYEDGKKVQETISGCNCEIRMNGPCWKKSLWSGSLEKWEQKDGKKHGLYQKYNSEDWLEKEIQYQNGKKHGYETKYNRNGTIASRKYFKNGVDCTLVHNAIQNAWKKVAAKRVEKEKQIEAETGVQTHLPKMSKREKTAAIVKKGLGLSK